MMDRPEIISSRLRDLRLELGYETQTAFANRLGIDKSTYNLYEKGKRPLTFETACLIRREFGISIDWLFFGDLQQSAIQTMAKIGRGTPVQVQKTNPWIGYVHQIADGVAQMTARQIANREIFLLAHADARESVRRFQMPYAAAFRNCLRGRIGVANGYTGSFVR